MTNSRRTFRGPSPSGRGQGEGHHGPYVLPQDLLNFAPSLRQEQTDAETRLWGLLRSRRLAGFKFRRQHPIPPYVADFYCHEAALVIEVDGGQHGDDRGHDERGRILEIEVCGLSDFGTTGFCRRLKRSLRRYGRKSTSPSPRPSPKGRGRNGEELSAGKRKYGTITLSLWERTGWGD